jgi:hypothetical protein
MIQEAYFAVWCVDHDGITEQEINNVCPLLHRQTFQ